ncbi:MAG: alpha/beta hydrolase [Crocinitomicaceae bacterium]
MKQVKNAIYFGADNKSSLFDISIPNQWNNKLIVFIHGYMGYKDWGCWGLVENYFNKKKYGLLKYNVSHNGGTIDNPIDFDDLNSFSHNNYLKELQDFEAITNIIQSEFKELPELYIIGHSRGGGIALLQSENIFISKIVSWSGICSIADRFPKGDALKEWKNNGYYYRENGRTKQKMPHSYTQYEIFISHKNRLNIESYCRKSTTPTLIVHGDKDVSVSINEGEILAEWLNTSLTRIKGAQHTFGASQPWKSSELPSYLHEACEATLNFFDD